MATALPTRMSRLETGVRRDDHARILGADLPVVQDTFIIS